MNEQQRKTYKMFKGLGYGDAEAQNVATQSEKEKPKVEGWDEMFLDVKETGTAISDLWSETGEKMSEAVEASKSGEQGVFRGIGQAFGIGAGGLAKGVGEIAIGAGKALLPQSAEESIAETTQAVVKPVVETEVVQDWLAKYEDIKKTDPQKARDLDALFSFGEFGTMFGLGSIGKKAGTLASQAVSKVEEGVGKLFSKTATKAAEATEQGAKALKSAGEFGSAQMTGLETKTLKTILDNPKQFMEAQKKGDTRFTLGQQVEEKIKTSMKDLSELGAGYNKIRKTGETIKMKANFVADAIKKSGFIIKDNVIKATTKSPTRNTADIKHLQDFYNNWKDVKNIKSEEFLNMRADLGELAKFDKISGKSNASEKIAKDVRQKLNDTYRKDIKGLKELDDEFSIDLNNLNRVKKEFFDVKNGELKSSSINKIANLSNEGRQTTLEVLKKIDPEIESKAKLIKALEDVEYAKGKAVGTYMRAGIGAGTAMVNPAAGLAVFFLTSPDMVVKYLTFMSDKLPKAKGIISDIQKKIPKGVKLNTIEKQTIEKIINTGENIQREFLETLGSGIGTSISSQIKEEEK